MKSKDVILGAVALGVGITLFKNAANNFFNRLQWRFAALKFDGIGGDFLSIRLVLALEVDNKNNVSIPLQSFDGKVYFKDAALVPVRTVDPVSIAANQKSTIRISIPISLANLKTIFGTTWKEILTNIPSGIRPGNYAIKGVLTFNVSNVLTKFELNEPFYVS